MAGNSTICPGHNFDPARLREKLRAEESGQPPDSDVDTQIEVAPGEHVILLPDADKYFDSAMAYIWKFQPDVSFSVNAAAGRWKYVTVVGNKEDISDAQLARLRSEGAQLVQRIAGDPPSAQTTLDRMVQDNQRFLSSTEPEPPPEPLPETTYTVQPGDTLSLIARQVYDQSQLWRIIFEANRNILSDPSLIRPGQVLKIPPKPE